MYDSDSDSIVDERPTRRRAPRGKQRVNSLVTSPLQNPNEDYFKSDAGPQRLRYLTDSPGPSNTKSYAQANHGSHNRYSASKLTREKKLPIQNGAKNQHLKAVSSSSLSLATSSKQAHSIGKLPIGASNNVFTCRMRVHNTQDGWYSGEVKDEPLDAVLYVKPRVQLPKEFIANKDVQIYKDKIEGFDSLPAVKKGDKIEFLLSTRHQKDGKTAQGIKPSAHKARIQSFCASRCLEELEQYFVKAKHNIGETSTRAEAINSIMMSDALWFYIFNAKCSDQIAFQTFLSDVLDFVFHLGKHMNDFPSRRKEIVSLIVERNFIEKLKCEDQESIGLRFSELAITLEPSLLKKVLPILSNLVKDSESNLSQGLYNMLLRVGSVIDLSNWHDLTPIPTIEEFFGDPLEKVKYLKPVNLKSAYKSTDEYLNVYYRLLRTECFSAIQRGISDMKIGHLDERDMSVYEKVSVKNIDLDHSSILLYLHFSLPKPVRNWKKSKKLMFGNLLCLTVKGDFSDPIWLTVADRDENILQKHSIIGVDLVSFGDSDTDSATVIRNLLLNSGKMIMAESPTYFQSFKHVLASLKSSEINEFCLVKEIVYGIFKKSNRLSLIAPYLKNVGYENLEDNQKKAFLHALDSTLGIIQGPPGTGKTFVGAKLAHMFLCLQDKGLLNDLLEVNNFAEPQSSNEEENNASQLPQKNPPMLILTYKNHALDEFLKHCTEFCDKEFITRIGSQSKEEVLHSCLLHNKMKSSKLRRVPTGHLIEEIKDLFLSLSHLLNELEKSKVFTFETFISSLSLDQLLDFIGEAIMKPWKSIPKQMTNNVQTMKACFLQWKEKSDFRTVFMQLSSFQYQLSKENQDLKIEKTIAQKVKYAFENHWLPNKQNLISLTQMQQSGAILFNYQLIDSATENYNEAIDEFGTDVLAEDNDDLDEDYINEQLSLRISAYDEDQTGSFSSKDFKSQKMARLEKILAQPKVAQNVGSKSKFCLSDFPPNCAMSEGILRRETLWNLSEIEKYTFIFSFLHSGCNVLLEQMNDTIEKINILQKQKELIDHNNKLRVLEDQRIVGATIIGASVQLSLISKLAPKVVLVEEAAEVLESCLVAVLSKSVQKLILIGDHKQLKPQVDTYYLRKEHKFHISMMERLIKIGFPYEKLLKQGRMRPEFSCMLKDIYPEYQDFPRLEIKNEKILCLPHSMFFWSHKFQENKDRSVKNVREANMVVALALFFISSGVNEADITILCAYLGQVQLVRKIYREMRQNTNSQADDTRQYLDIRTIDEYQGDENKFVIVSLTRSNSDGKLGFLQEIERRCVAQSRAKCGLYFVGNGSMFKRSKTWRLVMDTLDEQNLISEQLPVTCYRHPNNVYGVVQEDDVTKNGVYDNSQLMYYVKDNNWCKVKCNKLFSCEIPAHRCKKPCTPRHDDSKCQTQVDHTFLVCQHSTQKPCYKKEEDMKCRTKVSAKLACGHEKVVECHKNVYEKNTIICTETCSKSYDCQFKHKCNWICWKDHSHFAEDCPEPVKFVFPKCEHPAHLPKVCGKPIPSAKCRYMIMYKSDKCGHDQRRECSEKEDCSHPCDKVRHCGHPCSNICSKPCHEDDCQICAEKYQESLDAAKKYAEEQLKICRDNEADPSFFNLLPLSTHEMVISSGIKEKCDLFLNLYSTIRLKEIKSVLKVQCPNNSTLFWKFASKANGTEREELYNFSPGFLDTDGIVTKEQMLACLTQPPNNYFKFMKHASKDIASLPENDHTLVIAEVFLGDSISQDIMKKTKGRESVSRFLMKKKKDSLIANSSDGPATYFVYNSNQIHLKYIVQFTTEKLDSSRQAISQDALKCLPDGEKLITLSKIDLRDVSDPLIEMVYQATALYKGDCSQRDSYSKSRDPLKEVKSVGIVVNHKAEQAYEEKLTQWKGKCKEIYAYHATAPENVASIVKTNLDPNRAPVHGHLYGKGCYFSEHPEFSLNYGRHTMFIFRLLLVEGQYKKVQPDEKGFCQQLVLQDASLFKPKFVLHF